MTLTSQWFSHPARPPDRRPAPRLALVFANGHNDPLLYPDPSVVRAAIADYAEEAPVAFGIDFGIAEAGGTHLVEVNDGFSLGGLGLGPLAYSGFLEDRWRELVGTAPNRREARRHRES
jgi:hypothetical protein